MITSESAYAKVRELKDVREASGTDRLGLDPQKVKDIAPELIRADNGRETVDVLAMLGLLMEAIGEIRAPIVTRAKVKEIER